jgi:Arc/MetJ-type ribon-helix-helix transcriptional regulator
MSINDFEERIKALKAKAEEISLKFIEELKNESKNISTKLDELKSKKGRTVYEELRNFLYNSQRNLNHLKSKWSTPKYNFNSLLRQLMTDIANSNMSNSDKIKLYEQINTALSNPSERLKDSLKDLDNLVNEIKIKLQANITNMYKEGIYIGTLPKIEETINNIAKSTMKYLTEPTTRILSQIPESETKIIDILVETGIFKDRSEAVAFFVHKGIESSKELLSKANERIKEVQEKEVTEVKHLNIHLVKSIKCPFCGYEGEFRLIKNWRYNSYDVEMFECPKCKGRFNHYVNIKNKTSEFVIKIKPKS